MPTLGRAQDFLPIDSSYTQIDLDTDMEEESGPTQSKSNKKRVLMKLKSSSSSVRRETVKYEASSGGSCWCPWQLSPGGMSEFVQSVPANVAGFLMRSAAQSAPLRLWPTDYKMMSVIGEGQQPLRHVGSASRSLSGNQAEKVVFNGSPSEHFGPLSAKPGLFFCRRTRLCF